MKLLYSALCLVVASQAAGANSALMVERTVTLKPSVEVWSQEVCLQDLVSEGWVKNRCAIERNECCRWNLNGELKTTISRHDIQNELSKANLDGLKFVLSPDQFEVNVQQVGRALRLEEIQKKLVKALSEKTGEEPSNLEVSNLRIVNPIYVKFSEEDEWDISLPTNIQDKASIKIVGTKNATQILGWIQATLKIQNDVYVAKKAIHPTDLVGIEDFEVSKKDVLSLQSIGLSAFKKGQFPAGVRAKQSVQPGSVLHSGMIEKNPLVKLGDTVTLILRSDSLKISTKGVVQGTAALGDMVTVQLPRYNRTFRGRLVEGRLVEVWL